jgi:hypothetical protein
MSKNFFVAAVAPLLVACSVASANAQTIVLPPSTDCAFWAKVRNDRSGLAMVQGYLSGRSMGYWLQHTARVGGHGVDPLAALSSMGEAYTWLDRYCASNPSDSMVVALEALFADLEMRRLSLPRTQ